MDGLFSDLSSEDQVKYVGDNFCGSDVAGDYGDDDDDDFVEDGGSASQADSASSDGTSEDSQVKPEGQKEPEGQEQKAQGAAAQKEGEAGNDTSVSPSLYTEDEFLNLDPFQVDVNRLPRDARVVHERDMKLYREQIVPALQMRDQEIADLRAYKERVEAERVQPQSKVAKEPAVDYSQITPEMLTRYAISETARRFGVAQLDPANPEHMSMLSYISAETSRQLAEKQAEAKESARIESEKQVRMNQVFQNYSAFRSRVSAEPDFSAVDQFAAQEMNTLPYALVERIRADLVTGDPHRLENVYRFFEKRYRDQQAASKKVETAKPETPKVPKVVGGSSAPAGEKKLFDIGAFSRASMKDQSRMILEAGLY